MSVALGIPSKRFVDASELSAEAPAFTKERTHMAGSQCPRTPQIFSVDTEVPTCSHTPTYTCTLSDTHPELPDCYAISPGPWCKLSQSGRPALPRTPGKKSRQTVYEQGWGAL